jgi:hypothetical protein
VSTRIAASRQTILLAAIAAIALSMLYLISPVKAADPFNPGQNGAPTGGTPTSNLLGGTANFTFEQNAILSCNGDSATSFSFVVDYDVTGTLPDGATLVVYLSPNQGAINNNAGGDAAGYIAAVESNYFVADVGGLIGTGSFPVTVTVTSSFQLSGGGVLGVFADEGSYAGIPGSEWTSKSNSVQCSEAQSQAESVPASAEQSVAASASGEQSEKAGEGTPEGSQGNTSFLLNGSGPLATIAFSLILLASLGTLAYANVKSVRSRNQ